MIDMTNASAAGPSAWAATSCPLTTHVEIRARDARGVPLGRRGSSSKAFGYLVNLLIEDEIRHHRILMQLADSLETMSLRPREEPEVPYLDFNHGDTQAVLDLTERLLHKEQQDTVELKRIQRELRDVKDTSIWGLLVDLMNATPRSTSRSSSSSRSTPRAGSAGARRSPRRYRSATVQPSVPRCRSGARPDRARPGGSRPGTAPPPAWCSTARRPPAPWRRTCRSVRSCLGNVSSSG